MDEIIKAYYSPKTGYVSAYKLAKKIPGSKLKNVQEFIGNQYADQVTRQMKKPIVYNTVNSTGYGKNYQIDIIDYSRYELHHYRYILVVIDVYSRYADARAMVSRSNTIILMNLKEIFEHMGVPENINADNEFDATMLMNYFNSNKIQMHFSQPGEINKNAVVERFNRTLAGMLQKWREGSGEYEWYKVLGDIIDNYNNTYHRTIKNTPLKVKEGEDSKAPIIYVDHSFKVGDNVRKTTNRSLFDKGDKIKFSKFVYIITKIDGNKIYLDRSKEFYKPYELLKVNKVETKPIAEERLKELEIEGNKVKEAASERKLERELKKVGVDRGNIVEGKRKKKAVERLDL